MVLAVSGNIISPVTVAHINSSTSAGSVFVFSRSIFTASAPMSLVAFPGSLSICRCFIPVRDTIHSSFVSTIFSKSAFVSTVSGVYPAIPVIAALRNFMIILLLIFLLAVFTQCVNIITPINTNGEVNIWS